MPIFSKKIVPEALIAYRSRMPDSLDVKIRESEDGGYWVEIKNIPGCITQADNGEELFSMVNDAVYTFFEIPEEYIPYISSFLPSEETRKKFGIKIPAELLNKELVLQRN